MFHLGMFAKYWESGKVKTRLAKALGPDLARDVYVIFLRHLLFKFRHVGDERSIAFTPPESFSKFRDSVDPAWRLQQQSNGDLGERMRHFFDSNRTSKNAKNILIGSDTPDLPIRFLERASEMLDQTEVVIGPSADGGYYLIGIRCGEVPDIFSNMPWSTERVLDRTRQRLKQLNVAHQLLPEMKDVDELEDLKLLMENLRRNGDDAELLAKLQSLDLPYD